MSSTPQSGRAAAGEVDDLVTAVLTASRALVAVSAESLAAVHDTVTVTQFRTLVVLDSRGPISQRWLADELSINPSTVVRMLDRLEAADLVSRRAKPDNRREVELHLTPRGARLVREVTTRRRRAIARIVDRMPAQTRALLVEALGAFAEAAGEPAADTTSALGW
ncbi:MAG: MarR family winged helix-turn-helix transcriptional regulator [Jatrophihabitans sp.]|uniref:MarR family winged helix-turn-helix transcriptional regulator n=1 Tax=Jatrophihabitans sp. TaxID=1932789 RepID=UPI003F7ED138